MNFVFKHFKHNSLKLESQRKKKNFFVRIWVYSCICTRADVYIKIFFTDFTILKRYRLGSIEWFGKLKLFKHYSLSPSISDQLLYQYNYVLYCIYLIGSRAHGKDQNFIKVWLNPIFY
ncbi:hypothetical protein C1645_789891, partial [Glomus cerebriforme]